MLATLALGSVPASAASAPKAGWNTAGKPHVMPRLVKGGAGAASQAGVKRAVTNGAGQLFYGGAFVQDSPRVYLDFWGAKWTDGSTDAGGFTGAQATSYIEAFVSAVTGSRWLASQTQYCENVAVGATVCGSGAVHAGGNVQFTLGNVWNDTTNAIEASDPGVAAEADRARSHFSIAANDVNATVIVLTPTTQSYFVSGTAQFCGYHFFTNTTIYAYIPWVPDEGAACATNNVNPGDDTFGHGHFDGFSMVIGHEIAEAITDPVFGLDAQNQPVFGWLDSDDLNAALETADKCEFVTAWPATNAGFGANHFAVQPLWSNASASCPTEDLGGGTNGGASIASWDAASHRDAFVRGFDNALWWNRWNGSGWSGWSSLGGRITSDPAAVSWAVNRTDVFAIGGDGAMWHNAWTGSGWSGWSSLGGGFLLNKVAASSWQVNGLDVAAVGLDHAMWHIRWNGSSWSPWQSLGGGFTSGPSAVSWRDGTDRVDIFARGQDGAFWQDAWVSGSWTGWLARGGGFHSGPALTSTAPGRLQVYGVGLDGALWHETWNGSSWSNFSSLGAAPAADPAAVSPPGSGGVELAVVNANRSTERFVSGS
ncbi:MAG TPA: hypothetical protein VOB72_10220 [Candidatus Dormibacteraeota bacterium]|nr:hypothetical protein [Candidatus Dormibacteraeota bacterium]